jgi:hypothetical protein
MLGTFNKNYLKSNNYLLLIKGKKKGKAIPVTGLEGP